MGILSKGFGWVISVLAVCVFAAVNGHAGQARSCDPAAFSEFDADGNGYISEQEFDNLRAQRMSEKAAEGRQMRGAATAPAFSDIDSDGDGRLDPDELTAAQKKQMEKHHEKAQGKGYGHGHGYGHGKGKGAGRGKGSGCVNKTDRENMPVFSDFDLNGDGKILESEFNEGRANRMSEMAVNGHAMKHAGNCPGFAAIDIDKNGEISKQEFTEHKKAHHGHMHQKEKMPSK